MRRQNWSKGRGSRKASLLVLAVVHLHILGCHSPEQAIRRSMLPQVMSAIEFDSSALHQNIQKQQLPGYWNQKLKIGSNDEDAYEFLTIDTVEGPKRIRVETPTQYLKAIEQGAYAFTSSDMAMEAWFVRVVGTLQFLEACRQAKRDFMAGDITADVLRFIRAETDDDSPKPSLLNRVSKPIIAAGKHYAEEELARGDFDRDGLQDVLIFVSWRYVGGSGFGYRLYVASKKSRWSSVSFKPFSVSDQ